MAPYDPERDSVDLKGKVALVTGGNAGVGYETVKHLAKRGAKVYLGARNEERGKEAILRLYREGIPSTAVIELFLIDMDSVHDVKRAAEEFLQKEQSLDILVNNAAQLAGIPRAINAEGLERAFATNYLGLFLLTTTILPLLKTAASQPNSDVRIVNVASDYYKLAPTITSVSKYTDIDVIHKSGMSDNMSRYGISKLLLLWFSYELQKQLDAEGAKIVVIMTDPGYVASPGAFDSIRKAMPWPLHVLVNFIIKIAFATPAVGALPSQFAATSIAVRDKPEEFKTALIVRPGKKGEIIGQGKERKFGEELWALSERLIVGILAKGKYEGDN